MSTKSTASGRISSVERFDDELEPGAPACLPQDARSAVRRPAPGPGTVAKHIELAPLDYHLTRQTEADDDRRECDLAETAPDVDIGQPHANRIAMLGELTASLVHEMCQPLTAIVTNCEVALRWLDRPQPDLEEIRSSVDDALEGALRAYQIAAQIRRIATPHQVERSPMCLETLIHNSLLLLRHQLERDAISASAHFVHGEMKVVGDEQQLQQVVVNLLLNAIQAMTVSDKHPRQINIIVDSPESGALRCAVEDSGPGVPLGLNDRVFARFFTTKEGGMGLGLSICRAIVEAHGGRIAIESADTGGARAYFLLPLYTEERV